MASSARQHIKHDAEERRRFRRRAAAGFALLLLVLLALSTRFFWLQVAQHSHFNTRARDNRVRLRHLPPPRGLIYDRNGVLLADNQPAYRLEVTPDQVSDMSKMLQRLQQYVPISQPDLDAFRQQLDRHRGFEQVPIKFDLTDTQVARFAVNQWRFPAVSVQPYLTRVYPQGDYFSHVVGYVGRIDADDLVGRDRDRYAGTTHIGKTGIERYYESLLHGTPGYELAEVNASQRPLRILKRDPPEQGKSLVLTLDARLQKAAADALGSHSGSVVAIDPRNGQVLALVSRPGFNPNLFVNGISQTAYSALLEDPDNPFLHRALRGTYPPGSTIKPFMGLAGLESGLRTPSDRIFSSGTWYIPGHSRGYRDDRRGGFGWVDLHEAIEKSVNTYFYQLAYDMGIDRLSMYMKQFGFGLPTGIDLMGEADGVRPSRQWKRAHKNLPWYPGETVIAGIGQGYWLVTPLQLAHATAILAEDGISHRPHLLMATRDAVDQAPAPVPPPAAVESDKSISAQAYKVVHEAMLAVVNGHGTARGLGDGFPYLIAGKTGTAEIYSRTTKAYTPRDSAELLAKLHHALFIAYTPAHNPQIVVAVIVDHGAWGSSTAAPVARKVLDAWSAGRAESAGADGTAADAAGDAP